MIVLFVSTKVKYCPDIHFFIVSSGPGYLLLISTIRALCRPIVSKGFFFQGMPASSYRGLCSCYSTRCSVSLWPGRCGWFPQERRDPGWAPPEYPTLHLRTGSRHIHHRGVRPLQRFKNTGRQHKSHQSYSQLMSVLLLLFLLSCRLIKSMQV